MSVNWGGVIGGVMAVTGVAVAGVGLGGEALSSAIGDNAVGQALHTATETVVTKGSEAALATGLAEKGADGVISGMSGKTAAGIVGAALAAAGAGIAYITGKDDEREEEKARLARVEGELAQIKMALLRAMEMSQQEERIAQGPLPTKPGSGRTV